MTTVIHAWLKKLLSSFASKEQGKYGALIANITLHDETFEEALPALIDDFHHDRDTCIERGHPSEANSYLVCKSQLETLLTERNLDEIEEVMLKSENQKTPSERLFDNRTHVQTSKERNAQFLERVYYEIYKDDPTFKPELIMARAKTKTASLIDRKKALDNLQMASKFHTEETMNEAIQSCLKSHAGSKHISKILNASKLGCRRVASGMEFPTMDTRKDIGKGYKMTPHGVMEEFTSLTKVKVVLHPDGQGGFILKTAFPTL